MAFAFVRGLKIKNQQYLIKQRRHAHREDTTCEIRPGAEPGTALVLTPPEMPEGCDPKDYRALYRFSKATRGFAERQGAAIGIHLLVGVSRFCIEDEGALHESENPRNQRLLEEVVAWVESWAGAGSVFGARLDLDEEGGGAVDIFVAPIAEQKHKSGSKKLTVSVNKALGQLQAEHNAQNSYEALQTSWHAWAQKRLDDKLQRGEPAHKTNRKHLRVAEYKRLQGYLKADETLRREQEKLTRRVAALVERERRNGETRADLEHKAANLVKQHATTFKAAIAVISDPGLKAIHPPSDDGNGWRFDTRYREEMRSAIMEARPLWPEIYRFIAAAQEKQLVAARHLTEILALRDEVTDHLRERIDRAACGVGTSWNFGGR